MKFLAVTTFNAAGYERYGKRMVETFHARWPSAVALLVLAEGCAGSVINALDFNLHVPSAAAFKRTHRENALAAGKIGGGYNFRYDAIRFCHKVFAMEFASWHAIAVGYDALIWIDADTVTHTDVPAAFVESLLPAHADVAYLARKTKFTETGFVVFRATTPGLGIIRRLANLYRSGGVFGLREWHDAYAFDHVREHMQTHHGLRGHSLSGDFEHTDHPFVNGPLGAYMDHLKGESRKSAGRSRPRDVKTQRTEAWWRGA